MQRSAIYIFNKDNGTRFSDCSDWNLTSILTINQKSQTPLIIKLSLYFPTMLQDWLTESARLISKSGHTVEWVTPLGLPIIQPYHRTRNQVVSHVWGCSLPVYFSNVVLFL